MAYLRLFLGLFANKQPVSLTAEKVHPKGMPEAMNRNPSSLKSEQLSPLFSRISDQFLIHPWNIHDAL